MLLKFSRITGGPIDLLYGSLCALLSAFAPPVSAGMQVSLDIPLEQLMGMQMVKAASKFEQLVGEAPAAASVLTSADIRAHGWRTLGQALATLPGLYTTDDRNYTYLGARGFLRPGDYNSRFLLMIDGVRTNDSLYDQAMLGNEALVDMDMVQRIEFIPGAGSAMHGSSALFGVINVVTRDGNALAGPRVAAGAGSQGERRASASYGWHGQGGSDFVVAASVLTRDGENLYFRKFDTPGENDRPIQGRDGEQARQFLVKATHGGWNFSANHVHRSKQLPTGAYGALPDAPNRTMDAHSVAQLTHARSVAPGVALSVQALWGRADYVGHYFYEDPWGVPAPNVDGGKARWYDLALQSTVTRFQNHTLVLGADMGHDTRRDQFNFDTSPYLRLLDDRRSARRRALFVED